MVSEIQAYQLPPELPLQAQHQPTPCRWFDGRSIWASTALFADRERQLPELHSSAMAATRFL